MNLQSIIFLQEYIKTVSPADWIKVLCQALFAETLVHEIFQAVKILLVVLSEERTT